jgi:hypothetical protein
VHQHQHQPVGGIVHQQMADLQRNQQLIAVQQEQLSATQQQYDLHGCSEMQELDLQHSARSRCLSWISITRSASSSRSTAELLIKVAPTTIGTRCRTVRKNAPPTSSSCC